MLFMLFEKLAVAKNWVQENALYLKGLVYQDDLAHQAMLNDLDDLDELAMLNNLAKQSTLNEWELSLLAEQKRYEQALILKQEALEKANQLWWEQMWGQMLLGLKILTPFIVIAVIVSSKSLDAVEHVQTGVLTNCNISANNIPTNNILTNNIPANNIPANNTPTNNTPENGQEWDSVWKCIALAGLTVCAALIHHALQ